MKSSSQTQKSATAKRFVAIGALFLAAVGGAGFYFSDSLANIGQFTADVPREKVALALGREPLAALAMIALEEKFFEKAGLDVTVKKYNSGALSLKGLLAGEAPVATSADIPIAFESLSRQDFSIVATIGSSDNEGRIVARKDRGIQTPADLRGKRVATQKSSAVHFFLHMFLLQNGMSAGDVQLSYMKPDELVKALVNGDIDAFSMREPFASQAVQPLGDNALVFMQPGLYRKTFSLVVRNDFLKQNPQVVQRVITGLAQAEAFALQHPEKAREILARGLEAKPEEVAQLWKDSNFMVSLDQSLLVGLEDEAKWIIGSKLSDAAQAPSYLDMIHVDALKAINPIMVSLIH
jgi:ABC-type nitrate/sulfonate/bicarbonate transport system substrate-binding protein